MAAHAIRQTHATLTLTTDALELQFSTEDGRLCGLRRPGQPPIAGSGPPRPSIDVQLAGRGSLARTSFVRYLGHTVNDHDDAVELVISIGLGPLIIYDRYRVAGTAIARRVSVENAGDDDLPVVAVRLRLPSACVGSPASCFLAAPGSVARPRVAVAEVPVRPAEMTTPWPLAPGATVDGLIEPCPTDAPGLLALHDPAAGETLLCWYFSTTSPALPHVTGDGSTVTLEHAIAIADRLRPEVGLSVGTQHLQLVAGSWPEALGAYACAASRTLPPPASPPDWLASATPVAAHAAQLGGFRGTTESLPGLRALGFDTLCLLPVWACAGPLPADGEPDGDGYAVRDYAALDPRLGSPAHLTELVSAAHASAMRVLVELPLAGCAPDSRYLGEHPEWLARDDRGHLVRAPDRPDMVCFDWSSPGLQEHVLEQALALARAHDLDGLRVIPPHAAQAGRGLSARAGSGSLGYLGLIERLRAGLHAHRPDTVLVGDASGPLLAHCLDMAVDEPAHRVFTQLALGRLSAAELRDWLADELATRHGPPRACFTESQRTAVTNPLADALRGSRIGRMILAGMVICGFTPLVALGQIAEEGVMIARLLTARARSAPLRHGSVDMAAARADSPHVLAVLRSHAGERVLGLLNTGPRRTMVTLSLPDDVVAGEEFALDNLLAGREWSEGGRQRWQRAELASLRLTLQPFSAALLGLRELVPAPAQHDPAAMVPAGS